MPGASWPIRYALLSLLLLHIVIPIAPASAEMFPGEDSLVTRVRSSDVASYYELRHLLNVYQMRQYLSLPSSRERAKWVERFWTELDPTPTTDVNERRVEHEQRLATARKLYPSQRAPGWDARGEVIIRYGLPDSRTIDPGDVTPNTVVPAREIWTYRMPPMTVIFEDRNSAGEFTCVREPTFWWNAPPGKNNVPDEINYTPSMTQYVDWPAAGVDISVMAAALFPESHPDDYPLTKDELLAAIERAPALFSCDCQVEPLPLSVDIVSFRGGDRLLRAEINFEIPAEEVSFIPKGDAREARVELRALVRDFNMEEVAAKDGILTAALEGDSLADGRLLPGQIVLALKPGYYHIGLEAHDANSKRRCALTKTVELTSLGASPALSDIEFASSIEETEENRRFQKGTLQVVPHPFRTYRKPVPLSFYFEIYGLTTDERDLAFYRVEYGIDPVEKKRWGPVLQDVPTNITSSFETSGYGSMQPQRLSIATENLWEGPFKLIVTVTDRRTGRGATKSAKFRILE